MEFLYVIAVTPLLLAAAGAIAGWLVTARRAAVTTGLTRVLIAIASGAALLVMIGYWLMRAIPWLLPPASVELAMAMGDLRYALPLITGGVALIVLAFPVRSSGSRAVGAELSRRTLLTFSQVWWLVAFGVALLVTVAVALTAGVASSPDDEGRHTLYMVEVGDATMGTSIYGWHYSVLCLILLAAIVAIMTVDLALISRPALAADRDDDIAVRRARSLNVVRVGAGAVLLHLAAVLESLAGTSTLTARIAAGESGAGEITVGSSFAALTPFLYGSAAVVGVIGLALWFAALLSTVPAPVIPRRRVEVA